MGVLGLPSLYQLDMLLGEDEVPFLYQASDSTFARVLKSMWIHPLRVILKTIVLSIIRSGKGQIELPRLSKIKVGIVDATSFGKLLASVLSIPGEVDMPIDLEYLESKGKELAASYRLLERFIQSYGKGS